VLACLSRRRSSVQIRSGVLFNACDQAYGRIGVIAEGVLSFATEREKTRYANRHSGQAQTLVSAGSTPACVTRYMRRLGIGEPTWP
jgi:hypothetical protein